MDFYAMLDQVVELLRNRGRVSYRALKVHFDLDDDQLEVLKEELLYAHRDAVVEDGPGLIWAGEASHSTAQSDVAPAPHRNRTLNAGS